MTQPTLFTTQKPAKPETNQEWLKQLLAARWQRCPNCNQITLHGMDADLAAGMATADPTPLTEQQELACIIAHRPTYTLTTRGTTHELNDRTAAHTYGPRPSNHKGRTIIPAHQCGARFPGFIPQPHTTPEAPNDQPPF